MSEEIEKQPISEEQKRASVAIKKFYEVEPDGTNVLYKLAIFAAGRPDQYKMLKGMLNKEVLKIRKK